MPAVTYVQTRVSKTAEAMIISMYKNQNGLSTPPLKNITQLTRSVSMHS